jgi:hypothetical protein
LVERIEGESFWLFRPVLADVLMRREPLERLETLGEVVGSHEVREVSSKLVMVLVVPEVRVRDSAGAGRSGSAMFSDFREGSIDGHIGVDARLRRCRPYRGNDRGMPCAPAQF